MLGFSFQTSEMASLSTQVNGQGGSHQSPCPTAKDAFTLGHNFVNKLLTPWLTLELLHIKTRVESSLTHTSVKDFSPSNKFE
eukprot:m.12217 g.12217  ORF g.12217 m.12217 type:complete len:82 (+) comp3966_c0_seq1:745-990(+)